MRGDGVGIEEQVAQGRGEGGEQIPDRASAVVQGVPAVLRGQARLRGIRQARLELPVVVMMLFSLCCQRFKAMI